MSFQAYIDNIKCKTGKTPAEFKKIAEQKGLLKPGTKAGEIVSWLKKDFGLGHGHAMAIYTTFKGRRADKKDLLDKHFAGEREKWRAVFDMVMKKLNSFGEGVTADPVSSYISVLKGKKKFCIIQITKDKMHIGVKLKNAASVNRFESAGNWNTMMTHKISIISSKEIDKELISILQKAYEQS